MQCEMCGQENLKLVLVDVEGVDLNVCSVCAKFGKVKKIIRPPPRPRFTEARQRSVDKKELIQMITSNYSEVIKLAREKSGMKQVELAKMISERESVIASVESGRMEPSIKLGRVLEKALKIQIIEQKEIKSEEVGKSSGPKGSVTIGDLINIKKRR